MKRCNYCIHRDYTDRGEEVCTKYLVYVGDEEYAYCEGFEFQITTKKVLTAASIILLVLILIVSML